MENLKQFLSQYNKEYKFLYENGDQVAGYIEAVNTFDNLLKTNDKFKDLVLKFSEYREDYISSDREAAAFMFALEVLS